MDSDSRTHFRRRLLWAAWVGGLAVYTYLLIAPDAWLPLWLRATVGYKITPGFSVGKYAHGVTYAALTLWTFLLPVGRTGWLICLAILSAHGFLTEYVQTYIPGRHGRWEDVVTDHVGIACGLLLGWLGYRIWLTSRRTQRMTSSQTMDRDAGRKDRDARPL